MKVYEYPEWENTIIVVNDGLKRKYSDPYLCGYEFEKVLKDTVVDVLNIVKTSRDTKTMVVRILEGGKYYYVHEALSSFMAHKPLLGEIDIKSRVLYDPNDVVTRVIRDEGICSKAVEVEKIYIGDTIASGKTMLTLLSRLETCIDSSTEFVILGFVTYYGLDRIRRWFKNEGLTYRFIGYGGLLGLGSNLTDMTIGDKPSYIPEKVKDHAISRLGKEIAEKLCVIGDFTYSTKYIHRYIAERIIQLWEIGRESDNIETREKASHLIRKGLGKLMNMGFGRREIEEMLAEELKRRLFLLGEESSVDRLGMDEVLRLS